MNRAFAVARAHYGMTVRSGGMPTFERCAQHDLFLIQTGGGERLIPGIEATTGSRDKRDVVLLHVLGVQVYSRAMQLPKFALDGLFVPLAIATDQTVVQSG